MQLKSHLIPDAAQITPDAEVTLTHLLMQYKDAESTLDEAQDSVNEFRCREMWDAYDVALDAADVAYDHVESTREALTLELKNNTLKINGLRLVPPLGNVHA